MVGPRVLLFGLTFASWATSIPERGVFDGDGDRDGLLKGLVKLCSRSLVGSIMSFRLFHVTCKNMLSLGSLYLRKMASFDNELNLEVKG